MPVGNHVETLVLILKPHPVIQRAQQMAQVDHEGILFETAHRRKDGTTFPVEVSSRGTILGGERVLLSIIRDITARKQAEQALLDRTRQLEAIRAVTAEERVILSKDKHLRSRPAEREAFEAAGARCFVLTSEGQNRLSLLRNLLASWDEIAAREATVPAPFMYGIARDGRLTQWIPRGGEGSPTERARATEARRRSRRGGPLQDDLTRG